VAGRLQDPFLTLYHVLTSLATMRASQRTDITTRSMAQLNTVLDAADAGLLTSPAIRPLRNTLMHYRVDARIQTSALSLQAPLYGLVPATLPGHDHTTIEGAVTRQLGLTATTMNHWAHA
jgi:hypothetical protein